MACLLLKRSNEPTTNTGLRLGYIFPSLIILPSEGHLLNTCYAGLIQHPRMGFEPAAYRLIVKHWKLVLIQHGVHLGLGHQHLLRAVVLVAWASVTKLTHIPVSHPHCRTLDRVVVWNRRDACKGEIWTGSCHKKSQSVQPASSWQASCHVDIWRAHSSTCAVGSKKT